MSFPHLRGIVFDKDGTLIDYAATWIPTNHLVARQIAAGDEALAEHLLQVAGHDPRTDRITPGCPLAAGSALDVALVWAPLLPTPPASHLELAAAIDAGFHEGGLRYLQPIGDLQHLLSTLLSWGFRLGGATADGIAATHAGLSALHILDLFDFVAAYDSGHGHKPGPGMVLAFCADQGLRPDQVLVIGDNRQDIEMARAAGAGLAVAVRSGTGPMVTDSASQIESYGADLVLDDVHGLLDLLAPA